MFYPDLQRGVIDLLRKMRLRFAAIQTWRNGYCSEVTMEIG